MASKAAKAEFLKLLATLINHIDGAPAGAELTWSAPIIQHLKDAAETVGIDAPLTLWREEHEDGYSADRLDVRSPFGSPMMVITLWQRSKDGRESGSGKLTGNQRAELLHVLELWRRHLGEAVHTPDDADWIVQTPRAAKPAPTTAPTAAKLSDTQGEIIRTIRESKTPLGTIEEIAKATTTRYEPDGTFRAHVATLKRFNIIDKRNGAYVVLSGQMT